MADNWNLIDPWWNTYTETGHETALAIAASLEKSNANWRNSNSPFDTDPLATDLTNTESPRGPLQPTNEIEWSRWLAQLLRSSAALIIELFDVPVTRSPNKVVREERMLKGDGTFRRPDILIFQNGLGISIEVKIGDENYQKTAETARLVEQEYSDREWIHTLLLPKAKQMRLESIVDPPLKTQHGETRIEWDDPGAVKIIHWRQVTAAIRSLLLRGECPDEHWAANAYLFCAVAEQQLLNFASQQSIERIAAPEDIVDVMRPIGLATVLEEQLTYFQSIGES